MMKTKLIMLYEPDRDEFVVQRVTYHGDIVSTQVIAVFTTLDETRTFMQQQQDATGDVSQPLEE